MVGTQSSEYPPEPSFQRKTGALVIWQQTCLQRSTSDGLSLPRQRRPRMVQKEFNVTTFIAFQRRGFSYDGVKLEAHPHVIVFEIVHCSLVQSD